MWTRLVVDLVLADALGGFGCKWFSGISILVVLLRYVVDVCWVGVILSVGLRMFCIVVLLGDFWATSFLVDWCSILLLGLGVIWLLGFDLGW